MSTDSQWTELTYKGTTYVWQKRVTMVEMMKVFSCSLAGMRDLGHARPVDAEATCMLQGALAEREKRESRQSVVRQKQIKRRLSVKPSDMRTLWYAQGARGGQHVASVWVMAACV